MNMKIKRSYKIPDHITMGIFRLPIVAGVAKYLDGEWAYKLTSYEVNLDQYFAIDKDYIFVHLAHPGQWICELEGGDWMVLNDEDYKKREEL